MNDLNVNDFAEVFIRAEKIMNDVEIVKNSYHIVPEETRNDWTKMLDKIRQTLKVPAALILKSDNKALEIFARSVENDSLYPVGEKYSLDAGSYCRSEDSIPLHWADGSIFGTLCTLNNNENENSASDKTMLEVCKDYIEKDLELISAKREKEIELKEYANVISKLTVNELNYIGIIYADTNQFEFLAKSENIKFPDVRQKTDYDACCKYVSDNFISEDERKHFKAITNLDVILSKLETLGKFSQSYIRTQDDGKTCHQLSYQWLDDTSRQILIRRYDVTESFLREKEQLREVREARSAAEKANEAKTTFVSRMSHDMRTPMNGIIGMTRIAMQQDNPEKTRDCLTKIDTSSKFLLGLINDILDIQKVDSGTINLHPTPYLMKNFDKYIDSVIKPLYEEKHQTFHVETHQQVNAVPIIDHLRFNQIMFNLLSNSVKYTPDGGDISFIVNNEIIPGHKERITAIVKDNGIGMSREFQKVLFDQFTQEERENNGEIQGTGLGLSIVKKLVDLMGGTVEVESELNKGTTFTITLDFDYIDANQKEWEQKSKIEEYNYTYDGLAGKHILICEDNRINREIAKTLLAEKDMTSETAENGQVAVEMFLNSAEGTFDAILMDIHMPVMNGYDAAIKIRESARRDAATVPIIALTADVISDDVRRFAVNRMNGYVAKPVEPKALYDELYDKIITV